jgi:tetratricopeptide (TPR) repeat protein
MAAIKEFKKAFDYDPTYAEALIDIADAYKKLKDFKQAQYYYEKAIEVSPNYGVAYASLGDFLIQQSQRTKGMALINKGVEVDPKSYWAYALQGDNLRDAMEIDLAIKAHSKAHDLRPNYAFGYLNLAVTYLCANQPDKAIKLMDQAKTKFKWNNKWSTYFPITLYCAYMQNNQPGKAKAVAKEDLAKANKKEWPYAVLQYLCGTINKEQLMKLAVDQDKKTEAHAYAGYFEYYSGHKDKAKLHWQWVIKNGSPTYIEVPLSKYMLKNSI